MSWFVIHTKSNEEEKAFTNLINQSLVKIKSRLFHHPFFQDIFLLKLMMSRFKKILD